MLNKLVGRLDRRRADEWNVSLYHGKVKNTFTNHKDAVRFLDQELEIMVRDYGFNVGYHMYDHLQGRHSVVLYIVRDQQFIEKVALSEYEYVTSHYFFYSQDYARRTIDYKVPSFQQLTRKCVALPKAMAKWARVSIVAGLIGMILLMVAFFLISPGTEVKLAETYNPQHQNHMAIIGFLSASIFTLFVIMILNYVREAKFKKITRGDSDWHERYENVDWRAYYKFQSVINTVAFVLALFYIGSFTAFGYFFATSAMFEAYATNEWVRNIMYGFITVICLAGISMGFITYLIVRFDANVHAWGPSMMSRHGMKIYKRWLKGEQIPSDEMFNVFLPVSNHILYPGTKFENKSTAYMSLAKKTILELKHDINVYYNMILDDKLSRKPVNPEKFYKAKEQYNSWIV